MKELNIDSEFLSLIPPLSDEEFQQLAENIKADGCRDALVVWQGVIVDGHNRYRICKENNISFKTEEISFSDRNEAIEWMLKNQLGRRNLNDFQRNEVALRFQKVIAERMRKKMSERGKIGAEITNSGGCSFDHTPVQPSTTRKEMAKIAGTSEVSVYRTKQILEKGTPEQVERARKGGPGNTICGIHKEISGKKEPVKAKPKESLVELEENDQQTEAEDQVSQYRVCRNCHQPRPLTAFESSEMNGYPDDVCASCIQLQLKLAGKRMKHKPMSKEDKAGLNKIVAEMQSKDREISSTVDDAIEEFQINFEDFLNSMDSTLQNYMKVIRDKENNKKIMAVLSQAIATMKEWKGKYSYEKL